jgi:hypothetical protein
MHLLEGGTPRQQLQEPWCLIDQSAELLSRQNKSKPVTVVNGADWTRTRAIERDKESETDLGSHGLVDDRHKALKLAAHTCGLVSDIQTTTLSIFVSLCKGVPKGSR